MIINTSSWHCRIYDFFFSSFTRPNSLCVYFWKIVFSLIMSASVIFSILFACSLIGVDLAIYLLSSIGISNSVGSVILGTIIGIIVISTIFGVLVGINLLCYKVQSKIYATRLKNRIKKIEAGEKTESKSIVIQYIKARKEKICPLIDFVEK
ncbi:hypothetical protein CPT_Melville_092 [Salmonella phage Melville]|uniref:Uncharacterized protein n=1 Tax=Salmonella phage Melville TaxID=2041413 RepID=A0A2D1GLX7_9CAUD|nr:membrane protein [Salmonella phage Melville]ATN93066.1 hypothetical protein CPT_Melville_092 [Salmonella phage Melville]